jgi:hypothetical protein
MEKILRIEHSQVQKDKWDEAEFLSKFAIRIKQVQQRLSASNAIEAFSTHEAGHALYWEKLGSTVQHVGPTLSYMADFGVWHFYPIATIPSPSPTTLKANYQNLLAIAKGAAAGGEFVRFLKPNEDDAGDKEDHARFHKVCSILRENAKKQNKYLCFNEDKIWERAQTAVSDDLRDAEFQKKARERVDQIMRDCFG